MKLISILSLFGFLFVFNCLTATDLISDTCKKCLAEDPDQLDYNLCVSSLRSAPGSQGADLKGLLLIAINFTTASINRAESKAQSLIKAMPGDRNIVQLLNNCIELYSNATYILNKTIGAIASGDYLSTNVFISYAVDAPGDCDHYFTDNKISSPLATMDKEIFNLAGITVDICSLLEKQ